MKHRNRVPMIDGLAIDQAHKGGNPFKSVAKAVKKAVDKYWEKNRDSILEKIKNL